MLMLDAVDEGLGLVEADFHTISSANRKLQQNGLPPMDTDDSAVSHSTPLSFPLIY